MLVLQNVHSGYRASEELGRPKALQLHFRMLTVQFTESRSQVELARHCESSQTARAKMADVLSNELNFKTKHNDNGVRETVLFIDVGCAILSNKI